MACSKREGSQIPLLDSSGLAGGRRSSRLDADRWACPFQNPPGPIALIYIRATMMVQNERKSTNDVGRTLMCLRQVGGVSRTKDFPGFDQKLRGQGVSGPMIWIFSVA